MSAERLRAIAEQIARDLFTNGAGQRADRLVLTVTHAVPSFTLGGWSEEALADRIAEALIADDQEES